MHVLTPENTGVSQLACDLVNSTFGSMDGFARLRQDLDLDPAHDAATFGAAIARVMQQILDENETPTCQS